MTIFKTFWKVLLKYKFIIILYTVILVFFAGFNSTNSDNAMSFTESKPDVLVINEDVNDGITKSFIKYVSDNSNVKEISSEKIDDAVFYRDVNYVIFIREGFRDKFLNNKELNVEVKSTGDYLASLESMVVNRYINLAMFYRDVYDDEALIINNTEKVLSKSVKVNMSNKLDTSSLSKASLYYNFLSYAILASCIYAICVVLASFKKREVNKRTIISSTSYKEYNRKLLMSSMIFAIIMWIIYVLLSVILIGKVMFTSMGVLYIINSFMFLVVALSIGFLIGNVVNNKEAINGIINVVALGSSFLCGAFVPVEYLPDFVLKFAHVLPSYWYVNSNELIKGASSFDGILGKFLINLSVLLIFAVIIVVITNIISRRKRVIN